MNMVRIAKPEDAERINELRRQVNELHVSGRPNHFKAGFGEELRKHDYMYLTDGTGRKAPTATPNASPTSRKSAWMKSTAAGASASGC